VTFCSGRTSTRTNKGAGTRLVAEPGRRLLVRDVGGGLMHAAATPHDATRRGITWERRHNVHLVWNADCEWVLLMVPPCLSILSSMHGIDFRTSAICQNRQSADIARKRRSTARLQTDARPLRDGSERFGPGTQAYGQI
jgi:hypothetical protein